MKASEYKISSEKFVLRQNNENLHDNKLQTKPISYFKDALYRFTRNKASIVAAFIIGILILFAIIVPFITPYKVADEDINYKHVLPKLQIFEKIDAPFWNGKINKKGMSEETFLLNYAKGLETGRVAVTNWEKYEVEVQERGKTKTVVKYNYTLDTYANVGVEFMILNEDQYKSIQQYQDETGIQVIYPWINTKPTAQQDINEANYWYETVTKAGKTQSKVTYDENGIPQYKNIYRAYTGKDGYTSKIRIEGAEPKYDYAKKVQGGYEVRVSYYDYYVYYHTYVLKDRIKSPCFALGATGNGKDLLSCLSNGARFSFILAIIVASVNLFVGAIYGAIEGYYGGKVDIIMERIVELLGAVPQMIVIVLLKYHLDVSHIVILFIAFFATGWMGMAGRTRMQFYRFKNQEYVLVSRTLGARDLRVMFKHIFPNAIGTLITSCVLVIPSVIFSETSLTYLGIIDLSTGGITSVGTLLSNGQADLYTFPHTIIFPALFISLLMLSFNLFGNGLRDAFNPSLRGSEE